MAEPAATTGMKERPAVPGIVVFVVADIAAFGAFLLIFMVDRLSAPDAFARGAAMLHAGLGWANTFILVTSGACVAMAERAFVDRSQWRPWLATGFAIGAAFAAIKLFEYGERFDAGTFSEDTFTGYYFVLTGLHFAHYLVGMGLLAALLLRARTNDLRHAASFRSIAMYWHMVDLLWLLIFPVVYLQVTS